MVFYGVSTIADYLMPNPVYRYISNIYLDAFYRLEKRNIISLEIIGSGHCQTIGDERKIRKEYFLRTRKILESKLCGRDLIKRMNTRTVLLIWFSGPYFKLTREKRRKINQRTRKLRTVHEALVPRDDKDRLYVSRKGGEDSQALKVAYICQYKDLWTTWKRAKKDKLQQPVTTLEIYE